jgi:hypothetical protein
MAIRTAMEDRGTIDSAIKPLSGGMIFVPLCVRDRSYTVTELAEPFRRFQKALHATQHRAMFSRVTILASFMMCSRSPHPSERHAKASARSFGCHNRRRTCLAPLLLVRASQDAPRVHVFLGCTPSAHVVTCKRKPSRQAVTQSPSTYSSSMFEELFVDVQQVDRQSPDSESALDQQIRNGWSIKKEDGDRSLPI